MTGDVRALVEDLFRRSAGRLVATLTRVLGPGGLELAEESVQDALVAALQKWPFSGPPRDPEAWLFTVARNRALDRVRRGGRWEADLPDAEIRAVSERLASLAPPSADGPGTPLDDDELVMLLLCCHPALPPDGAVALTLRTVGGLSTREIAAAFLVPESTMAQRIVRARRAFTALDDPMEMPPPGELAARVERVVAVLYLMFNEGYAAAEGDHWVRAELCHEAIRLAELLVRHPATARPELDALLALFLFQASRLPARAAGAVVVPFEAQDRALWDRDMIARAFRHLDRSRAGTPTPLHLEAGIAAEYAGAGSLDEVAWDRVVRLYDALLNRRPSAVVAVNRALAVGMLAGPAAGLDALQALDAADEARLGWRLPAARAWLLERAGAEARPAWRAAAALAPSHPVRRHLEDRAGGGPDVG